MKLPSKDCDATCSVVTRSTASLGDAMALPEGVKVVIKDLNIANARAGHDGMKQDAPLGGHRKTRSMMSSRVKTNSSGIFKSLTRRGSMKEDSSPGASSEHTEVVECSVSADYPNAIPPQPETSAEHETLPKRWVPKSKKSSPHKKAGLLSSFTLKKSGHQDSNHSSHPASHLSNTLLGVDEGPDLRPNSDHNSSLTDLILSSGGDAPHSAGEVAQMLRESLGLGDGEDDAWLKEGQAPSRRQARSSGYSRRQSSDLSNFSETSYLYDNELDDTSSDLAMTSVDSYTMLAEVLGGCGLGECPSSRALNNVAALRAKECIEDVLSADVSVVDRDAWDNIPQYSKTDMVVGRHLGKGTFSDAFEVFVTVREEERPTKESLGEDGMDLERMIERKFPRNVSCTELDKCVDAASEDEQHAGREQPLNIERDGDELDKAIDAAFGPSHKEAAKPDVRKDAKEPQEFQLAKVQGQRHSRIMRRGTADLARPVDLGRSVCMGAHSRSTTGTPKTRDVILAMKCLRPQIRSDPEQFLIGVEDLVQETALLASLSHPNIIKLHGRAGGGCVSNSFRLSDGYFILLDRLQDSLEDRIVTWRKRSGRSAPPFLGQVRAAMAIADAISYLHSKNIVFRDLKPANVGFDGRGQLKLFDFGFAVTVDQPSESNSLCGGSEEEEGRHLLYDMCGTVRYMAPEVALAKGYGLPVDVYSFGIVLWEVLALKKPFRSIKHSEDFYKQVHEKGMRPRVCKAWPQVLKDILTKCWSSFPDERPEMSYVKSILAAHAKELSMQGDGKANSGFRRSIAFRRFSDDV